jgi:hypothetical protein
VLSKSDRGYDGRHYEEPPISDRDRAATADGGGGCAADSQQWQQLRRPGPHLPHRAEADLLVHERLAQQLRLALRREGRPLMAVREPTIEEWEERRRKLLHPPGIMRAAQMLREAKDKPDFLVHERIPAGGLSFIVAKPGATKSWLAYDLALAVCQRDRRWLGVLPNVAPAPVLVLSYDNPTPETARRFKRLGLAAGDPIYFHSVDRDAWKMPASVEQLTDLCHELHPKLVIVDSFRQAVTGNENDSEEMGVVMGGFKAMAACPSRPAVVIVHHAKLGLSLDGGAGTRGSGEIEGSADAVLKIEDSTITWTKARSWLVPEGYKLKYKLLDIGSSTTVVLAK